MASQAMVAVLCKIRKETITFWLIYLREVGCLYTARILLLKSGLSGGLASKHMQWRKVKTFIMPAAPEVSCWQEDGVDQPYCVCTWGFCWSYSAAEFEVPPKKVWAGRCVQSKLLIWLRACFLLVPWGASGENDVWEQTDIQSPWVITCVPSVLFCLLGWDANVMNFNWKRKIFWWKRILRRGSINYRIIHGVFVALENSAGLNNVCLYIQIVCVPAYLKCLIVSY